MPQITYRGYVQCTHNYVVLYWIKEHSGSRANDATDELVRKGSETEGGVGSKPLVSLPYQWSITIYTTFGQLIRFVDKLGKHFRRPSSTKFY